MATSLTAPSKHSRPTGTFRVTIASLLFVELFSGVLQVYFTPLYPALAAEFGVDVGTVSWALIAFTLAGGVSTPLFARLGDMYGHRRMLRVLLGVVALGSILIAVAPNFPTLLVGRVLQGAFPPFLPLMFGLMRSRFSAERTNRGIAYLSSILLFGLLVGSAATGLLVLAAGGPGWALWLPAIGTVLGFGLLFLGHTEPAPDRAGRRVDLPGALLLGLGLVLLLLGFNKGPEWGWGSIRILAPLVIGALVLVGWVVMELRVREPLADLRFLFRPQLVPVYVVGVSVYFGSVGGQVASSTFMALPTKLGYGLGLSGFAIGLVLLPILATAAVMALLTARLGRALGFAWVMTIGAGLGALGNVGLIFFHGTIVEFVVCGAVSFGGLGFIEGSTRTVVIGKLRSGEISMGQGIYELSTTVGGSVGAAVLGAILTATELSGSGAPSEAGYRAVWAVIAAFGLLGTIVAMRYATTHGRRGAPVAELG